jgi:hypothetical protein
MKLIGVAGFARSGKDTIAHYLVKNHGFTKLAFADPMREMLYATNPIVEVSSHLVHTSAEHERYWDIVDTQTIFIRVRDVVDKLGWEGYKLHFPEIRELLQRLGTEGGRKVLGDTIWTDALMNKARAIGGNIVVSDVRFEDECETIRMNAGKVIRVTRPGISSVNDHITDKRLPDAFVDYEVHNDGSIKDLEGKVAALLNLKTTPASTQS